MLKFFFSTLFALISLSAIAQNCTADYGTITAPQGISAYVCHQGVSATFVWSGNNTAADYSSVLVVADASGNILFINNANAVDFGAYSNISGTVFVHALNIRSSELPILQTAISIAAVATIADLQAAIVSNQFCADLAQQGAALTVAEPIDIEYSINCDNTVGEFTIAFEVSGGLPELLGDPSIAYYAYTGVLSSTSNDVGTTFSVGPYSDNTGFTLEVNVNDNFCPQEYTSVSEASIACTKCHADPGVMPQTDLVTACGGLISVLGSISVAVDSGAVYYALHTNPNDELGDILALDTNALDGTADFSGLLPEGAEYGVTYYISAVGSNLDETGMFDWNSECLKIAPGTPVQFSSPILIDAAVTCIPDSGTGTVVLSAAGENSPFSIGGDLWTGFLSAGEQSPAINNVAAGTYSATVINTVGCIAYYDFVVDCGVSVGNTPQKPTWNISLQPQPAVKTAMLNIDAPISSTAQLGIYDLSGKSQYQSSLHLYAGTQQIPLDLSAYSAGIYLLRISSDNQTATAKLIVGQ